MQILPCSPSSPCHTVRILQCMDWTHANARSMVSPASIAMLIARHWGLTSCTAAQPT